ncbi:MAG: IS3 family transposase [bacterium]|nr:IS3 family transposase [bacterium]
MRYTQEQISVALLLLKTTGSPTKVIQTLGYPSSPMLYHWRDNYPEYYDVPDQKHWKQAPSELKQRVIKRCFIDGESVKLVAEEIGYTPSLIYKWIREYREKGHFSSMKKTTANIDVNPTDIKSAEDINALKAQMLDMQMEIDILKETIDVLKKDPGVDQTVLKNREKAVIIDALKNKYSLPMLCVKLNLAKSSYYYQEKAIHTEDKYLELRKKIIQLFHDNRDIFGYRKIHMLLRNEGTIVSEKVVRRIMKQEALIVKQRHKHKYNSYKGEITPAVGNVIDRDFHADKPNQKWLTDITEFSIKASKVYLSPMIDCLDGMPVTWTIGTSPNSELANTMLKNAIATLYPGEKPIVHSDRGCHYRWPEWIKIMEDAGLTRSMSKKGCSPDNSACEGFFGHLKTEMFYGHNWDQYSIEEFIHEIDDYMHWYCKDRIKSTLGGLSPLDYRRSIGAAV